MNKWEEKFPVGSVVYYFKKHGMDWDIEWGTVDSYYYDSICLQTYVLRENRVVNGVPYNDFIPDTRRKKLPKGWNYNTPLYTMEWEDYDNEPFDIKSPKSILNAIDRGMFIKTKDKDFSHIDVDITKEGWRLRKTFYLYEQTPSDLISCPYNECFAKFDEANEVRIEHIEEILRQRNLTDYEWAVEQIDNTLNQAQGLHIITEGQANFIKQQLLNEDVENVETRIYMGQIQWKLWKNKKWMGINY